MATIMHVALQTFDIVDTIFALIQQDSNVGRQSLRALATTSTSLSELALDRLWKNQSNFIALVKTLPPNYWYETPKGETHFGNYDFRVRNLNASLLERFSFYATRIRRLSYVPHAKYKSLDVPLDVVALRDLWSLRPDPCKPILPNLKRVDLPNLNPLILDIVLASPSIDLEIGTGSKELTVAYSLQNFASNISCLRLGSPEIISSWIPSSVLFDALSEMGNLRVLTTSFKLNRQTLSHLASHPFLNELGIPNSSQEFISAIASSSATFLALRELEIVETNFADFARLLQKIGILQLRRLTIHSSASLKEYELDEILLALQQARGTEALCSLRLQASKSSATFNSATLRPLLSARHLSALHLDVSCQYDLTNYDLKDMATAWPSMRSLQIGPLAGWSLQPGAEPLTTFHGLLYLLEGCRHLERLVFCINGLIPPPIASDITPLHINHRMTILWLGDSPIQQFCVTGIREFLSVVLPNLIIINGKWTVTPSIKGKIGQQQRLWMEVAKSEEELRLIYTSSGGFVNEFR